MRLTWTTSKPPEPSARSAAWVLTTTSSPACGGADERDVGDRGPRRARDLDDEALLRAVGRVGLDHRSAAQDEHQRTLDKRRRSAAW